MVIVSQLRNRTCLHASAVVVDGRILALLGAKGAGKSTSAAAFARAGYPVLADDIVVLAEQDGRFMAEPAYPSLRLWPSSVEALFGRPDALPLLTPTWDKRGLDLTLSSYQFQEDALPLAALYVLGERSALGHSSIPQTRFSVTLHSCRLFPTPGRTTPGRQYSAISLPSWEDYPAGVPIRKLVAHEDSRRLPELCQLLVDDIRSLNT